MLTTHLIKGKYRLVQKIGQGAFGEIYSGKSVVDDELVAIKLERIDSKKQILRLEVAVLKKLQESPYVCRFITCGRFGEYNYLVMELMGENLSELRRRQPLGKFSMVTTARLGIEMVKAIQSIHELGYLHRDVKPSNFVIGLGSRKHNVYVIDFGLSRRWITSNGQHRPPRQAAGFRGTARYASIQSHLCQDLSRRDDLWSIFYILVEFATGMLPWRKLKDKDKIAEMKIRYNTPEFVMNLPEEFLQFMEHLQSLDYYSRPDYPLLLKLLQSLFEKAGGNSSSQFDWELNGTNILENSNFNITEIGRANSALARQARALRLDLVDRRFQSSPTMLQQNQEAKHPVENSPVYVSSVADVERDSKENVDLVNDKEVPLNKLALTPNSASDVPEGKENPSLSEKSTEALEDDPQKQQVRSGESLENAVTQQQQHQHQHQHQHQQQQQQQIEIESVNNSKRLSLHISTQENQETKPIDNENKQKTHHSLCDCCSIL